MRPERGGRRSARTGRLPRAKRSRRTTRTCTHSWTRLWVIGSTRIGAFDHLPPKNEKHAVRHVSCNVVEVTELINRVFLCFRSKMDYRNRDVPPPQGGWTHSQRATKCSLVRG